MFKRIVKIVGFVILGFVLLIGGVVGVMAIRGDFKKQVIKPTAINFSIDKTELILDATVSDKPTLGNGRVYSFTIKAEPLEVNVTECTLKLSSPLITFVKWDKEQGEWVENKTSTFDLNTPIYFVVNNVVDSFTGKGYEIEEEDYYDGVLTITVKDKSGLLQDSLELEIDRAITSISFRDRGYGKESNNVISNGLFGYELKESYKEESWQKLEAIQREDYPLEIITAPLKASKPFSGEYPEGDSRNLEKIQEIYYVKDGQPRLVVHNDDVVKLQRYDDQGNIVEDGCDFLTYDIENNRYVFNSGNSGDFEFLLATYPTYEIQERILSQEMSFIERLQSREENDTLSMLTKKVVITVNGTEADNVEFRGEEDVVSVNLLQDNKWIANNSTTLDKYNLGLTLSKNESGTGINSRYNELEFLTNENFVNEMSWEFKRATKVEGSEPIYTGENVTINFVKNVSNKMEATIIGLSNLVDNTVAYDAKLTKEDYKYILTLNYVNPENLEYYTTITFELRADETTGRTLLLTKDGDGLSTVTIKNVNANGENESIIYLALQVDKCFVLDAIVEESENVSIYNFKTLEAGVYLALLGNYGDSNVYKLINDKFITSISHNGPDTEITLKPIDADVKNVKLYAIVVNSNGTYHSSNCIGVTIVTIESSVEVLDTELNVPIIVGESITYDSEQFKAFGNGGLFILNNGSYSQGLLFSPLYTKLEMKDAPKEWGKGLEVYTFEGGKYIKVETLGDYESGVYYVKNNFKMIDLITYTQGDIVYYLVGYIENNGFVNKVVPTNDGPNYYTKLYPAVIKSKYLIDENRLQTAEEVINDILSNKYATTTLVDGGEINYDLTLLPNRKLTETATMYVTASDVYDSEKTYYIFSSATSQYVAKEMTEEDIYNWSNIWFDYYEKVNAVLASDLMENAPDTNSAGLIYYTKSGETLNATEYLMDDWSTYYIIVDYYLIESHQYNGENIEIKAYPYTKIKNGQYIKLDKSKDFIISVENYNIAIGTKFNIDIPQFFINKYITVNSYYAFAEDASSIKPQISFGGTYFEDEQTKAGDFYTIIAGHKNVEVDWDGNASNVNNGVVAIKDKDAITFMTITHSNSEEILRNIEDKLTIHAYEYDENGNNVGVFTGIKTESISLGYMLAGEYKEGVTYYKVDPTDSTKYVILEITDEVIQEWADNSYYVLGIYAKFEINGVVGTGHYVKLEWTYSGGNDEYKIYSPKLRILSRQLEGYTIDVSSVTNNAESLYVFVQDVLEDSEQYKKQDESYVKLGDGEEFNGTIYYRKEFNPNGTNINFQLKVGYDSGNYTYNIYAVDEGNNLIYYCENDVYKEITSSVGAVFKLRSNNNGWIVPKPVYAQQPEFTIDDTQNSYLKLIYDYNANEIKVDFVRVSEGFTQLLLKSNDGAVKSTAINVYVVADEAFAHEAPITPDNGISGLEYDIPSGMFKYGNTEIDNLLNVSITDFSIVRNGENVSANYAIKGHQIVLKTDENQVIAELKWDEETKQLIRTNYDNISITLQFESVLKSIETTFTFTSPYKIIKSTTNTTSVIYSGTKFVLAHQTIGLSTQTQAETTNDTLFEFVKEQKGTISIRHNLMSQNDDPIIAGETGYFEFNVPDVNKPTNYTFIIYFGEIAIGSFGLTVKPNILITTNIDELIRLDDLNNNTYNFVDLQISKYDTNKSYYSYTLNKEGGLEVITNPTLSYEITTFTDSELKNEHTVNIVSINDDKLQVAPISTLGTYYVNVKINNDSINIGEVKFIVDSISQVTSSENKEVESLSAEAQVDKEYTLEQLKEIFNLSQNGEKAYYFTNNWIETNEFKAGETYVWDEDAQDYVLLNQKPAEGEIVTMYRKEKKYRELSDILWIEYSNEYLNIVYTYVDNVLITQKLNTLTYNGVEYTLLGTSFNMTGLTFDITSEHFKDANGNKLPTQPFGNNIVYYMVEGKSVIYCKQNAYLFENGNDILAISINDDGKTLYTFVKEATSEHFEEIKNIENAEEIFYYNAQYTLVYGKPSAGNSWQIKGLPPKVLGNLQSLTLKYNSFGTDLATDADIIDVINYKADLVFDYETYKYTIRTDESYSINIYSNRLVKNNYTILNDVEYELYGANGDNNTALFLANDKVKSVEFGAGDYTLVGTKTIKFDPKGNSYTTLIPVTLTYNDGTTFTYHEKILVVNSTVVNIKYPYNVDNSYNAEYNEFNASISVLTNSVDGQYNINDFANWLGVDTSATDWQSNTTFAYDLALRSDTINLATSDELHNTKRYNVYKYEQINSSFTPTEGTEYYTYNSKIGQFELAELESGKTYSANLYFTRVEDTTTPISKIEVVATSSTYAIGDEIVKSWFDDEQNDDTIIVKSPADKAEDETLNLTGYVAFKVYAGDTGAYGYYLLKIVADTQFDRVVSFGEARNTKTISHTVTNNENENVTFRNVLNETEYKIHSVANNISSDLILDDYSNVYLFKVSGENFKVSKKNIKDATEDYEIEDGQYIPIDTILAYNNNIQTVKLAVVVRYGTSLVHVCNYEVVLQPNIIVEIKDKTTIEATSEARYEYSFKEGKALEYVFGEDNITDLSKYFEVTKNDGNDETDDTISLTNVEFVVGDTSKPHSDRLGVTADSITYSETGIVTITDKINLKWENSISYRAEFWVKMTYGSGENNTFDIYLRVILAPFEFVNDASYEVGGTATSDNLLDLTEIFGDYKGAYTYIITDSLGAIKDNKETNTETSKVVKFNSTYEEVTTYYITITLTGVYPSVTSDNIRVDVKPNIEVKYNTSYDGYSPTGTRVTPNVKSYAETGVLGETGSQLKVNINTGTNYTEIKIQDIADNKEYLNIKVKDFSSVDFELTSDNGDMLIPSGSARPYNYFVGKYLTLLSETGTLDFVHSASNVNLRLNIIINTGTGDSYATTYVLYLTLPATYELSSIYRVDGAQFETVIADSSSLTLKQDDENTTISKHFFGTEYVDNSAYATVNESRIAIKVGNNYYYGYNNIKGLGLFTENNPNRLGFSLELTSDKNTSSIDNGVLTFRSSDNDDVTNLILSNATLPSSLVYEFRIFDETNDYSNIEYNKNLSLIDLHPTDSEAVIDYISIPYSQWVNVDGKNVLIDLAYLEYDPTAENQVADIVMIDKETNKTTNVLNWEFKRDIGATDYVSRLVLSNNSLDKSKVYEIELSIITTNGVSSKVTLVIADFEAEYGYAKVDESYEYVYGGTQIGKLSDNDFNGNTRLNYQYALIRSAEEFDKLSEVYTLNGSTYTKVTTKPTTFKKDTYYKYIEGYTLDYVKTINGHVTQWYLGEIPPFSTLVNYGDDGVISLLNVANDTAVTLVFNVKYNNKLVVGRIFYKLIIRNNLVIGVNPLIQNSVIDLYLGSEIYKPENNETTEIDLLQSQEAKVITENEWNQVSDIYTYDETTKTYTKVDKPGDAPTFNSDAYKENPYYRLVYNNLFVTLEQNSTGNTIAKGKALYNGDKNTYLGTGSQLSSDVVTDYLRFSITELDDSLVDSNGNPMVNVDSTGKLTITGNPSGSFVLKISAANETGYGIWKVININKYDYTQAQWSESINTNSGDGWASGESINLFRDIGLQQSASDKGKGDYAFASYRLGYSVDTTNKISTTKDLSIVNSDAKVAYKVLTFDYGTSITDIKNSTEWDNEKEETISEYASGLYELTLPSVKANSTTEKQYQIVSIRLTIYYNETDTTNYYYAHYLVYNADQIKVNEFYSGTHGQVITYAEPTSSENNTPVGAWQSGSTLIIMDTNNQGLYSALTLLRSKPKNWEEDYGDYYKSVGDGSYTIVGKDDKWAEETYYKLNNTITLYEYNLVKKDYFDTDGTYYCKDTNGLYYTVKGSEENPLFWSDNTYYSRKESLDVSKYKAYIIKDGEYFDKNGYALTCTNTDGIVSITMKLPTGLFENKADITIIIKAVDGGAKVVEDKWTIKANQTIEYNDIKPLSDFFLLSEVGQDLYQNYDIIGLTSTKPSTTEPVTSGGEFNTANSFLKSDSATISSVQWTLVRDNLGFGYSLYKVTYTSGDVNSESVFTIKAEYYVLVGHSTAMSFTFNAGADYFINLTIDDSTFVKDEKGQLTTTATINLANFMKVWSYSAGKFIPKTPTDDTLIIKFTLDNNKIIDDKLSIDAKNKNIIVASDIHTITKNEFITVTITCDDISRQIQLYFNIVINAREKDDNGKDIFDENTGMLNYNSALASAMVGRTELSNEEINTALKKELLSLIKFNDSPVVNNGVVDNSTLNRYSISVKDTKEGYYEITYTYTGATATYTRTLKISSTNLEET